MSDRMDAQSVVEELRLKTEELDMNYYLKAKWGGYTKQSVLDYLNLLRKQQQTTAETFYRNLQTAYNEKEELNKSNQTLQNQLQKIESEYKNLCESIELVQLQESDVTMQNLMDLKTKYATMEEEAKKIGFEKMALENEINHLKDVVNSLNEKLEIAECENAADKEVIISKMQESKQLREQVIKLTIDLEDKTEEIKYLKAVQSEGNLAELTSHIEELTNRLTTQTAVMGNLNIEVSLKEKVIETLTDETELHKQIIDDLNKTVAELQKQNDKLLSANTIFCKDIQEKTAKTIDLILEKSDINVEKIAANRKLDEANAKIAMLELKMQQICRREELKEGEL